MEIPYKPVRNEVSALLPSHRDNDAKDTTGASMFVRPRWEEKERSHPRL